MKSARAAQPDLNADLLRDLLTEMSATRSEIAALRAEIAMTRSPSDEKPRELLALLFREIGSSVFTAADIVDRAHLNDLDHDTRLSDGIRKALGAISGRKIGTFCALHEGQVIDGFLMERLKNTRDGYLWKISCESENAQTRLPARNIRRG